MGKGFSLSCCLRLTWLPVRGSLALLVMLGLINVFMVRVNLSVAIVAMVRQPTPGEGNRTTVSGKCVPPAFVSGPTTALPYDSTTTTTTTAELINISADSQAGERSESSTAGEAAGREAQEVSPALLDDPGKGGMEGEEYEEKEDDGLLDWDGWVQGLVLSSFFNAYWISQVTGGRLAEVCGTKLVLGVTVLSGGVAALLTPLAARTHYGVLIALRMVQGFLQGATFPCIFPLMIRWIPRFERAKFIAYILFCNNISITFTMAFCGMVIDALGWEAAFYVTGVSSLAWCLLWYTCMYETPQEHPRITQEELNYILQEVSMDDTEPAPTNSALQSLYMPTSTSPSSPVPSGDTCEKIEQPKSSCCASSCSSSSCSSSAWCPSWSSSSSVPWRSLAVSLPVWAIIVCEAGNSFGYTVYFAHLPTYLNTVLGVAISENGLLSALPFLARYVGGVLFATVGEWLLKRGCLTALTVRRVFSAVAMLGPAATLLAVAEAGCVSGTLAVVLLCLGFFFNGAITVGLFANKADLSANYAGTVCGIGNTSANVISFIVPMVVGAIMENQQTVEQWRTVFWVCAPVYVACEAFFFVFASSSRQSWDLQRCVGREEAPKQEEEAEERECLGQNAGREKGI